MEAKAPFKLSSLLYTRRGSKNTEQGPEDQVSTPIMRQESRSPLPQDLFNRLTQMLQAKGVAGGKTGMDATAEAASKDEDDSGAWAKPTVTYRSAADKALGATGTKSWEETDDEEESDEELDERDLEQEDMEEEDEILFEPPAFVTESDDEDDGDSLQSTLHSYPSHEKHGEEQFVLEHKGEEKGDGRQLLHFHSYQFQQSPSLSGTTASNTSTIGLTAVQPSARPNMQVVDDQHLRSTGFGNVAGGAGASMRPPLTPNSMARLLLEAEQPPEDSKIVLTMGTTSRIIPADITFDDLKSKLESDVGEPIALRYKNPTDGGWVTLQSDNDLRCVMELHKQYAAVDCPIPGHRVVFSPILAPVRLLVEPQSRGESMEDERTRSYTSGSSSEAAAAGDQEQMRHTIGLSLTPARETTPQPFFTFGDGPNYSPTKAGPRPARVGCRTGMGLLAVRSPHKPRKRAAATADMTQNKFEASITHRSRADDLDSSGGSAMSIASYAGAGVVGTSIKDRFTFRGGTTAAGELLTQTTPKTNDTMASGVDGPAIVWTKGHKLGHGAFGAVYSALDLKTGLRFAIKQVNLGCAAGSPGRQQGRALQQEVFYLESLSHPNIIKILGTHRSKQRLTIFLEYASDGSLASMLSEFGPLSEGIIRSYTRQILDGLRYLHMNRIIHRDIKPGNILINKGEVKLADFGASKRLDEELLSQTEEGIAGTVIYMSPEVMTSSNGRGYGRRADIWSLGITLVEVAWGEHPFNSLDKALTNTCYDDKPLPIFPTHFTREGQDFLSCCLIRNPKLRWTAGRLRQHDFCRSCDDPRLVQRHDKALLGSSRTKVGTQRTWSRETMEDSVSGSQTAAVHSMQTRPFVEEEGTGFWLRTNGMNARQTEDGYESPRVVSSPATVRLHKVGALLQGDKGWQAEDEDRETVVREEKLIEDVPRRREGPSEVVKRRNLVPPLGNKLGASMTIGASSQQTPLVAISPEERRRSVSSTPVIR